LKNLYYDDVINAMMNVSALIICEEKNIKNICNEYEYILIKVWI